MRNGKVSLGNRIISMVLAVVMVLGMVPLSVFDVFAADATQTSAEKLLEYAEKLLEANKGKTSGDNQKFTWSTESKNSYSSWRYYNGVMLDGFIKAGTDASKNALEFAHAFYQGNLNDSDKVTRVEGEDGAKKEVDSIPAALAMFDLLGTNLDDGSYKNAIKYMYSWISNTSNLSKPSGIGGNYRHKPSSASGWGTYEYALDGAYMALPFLMEYAAALKAGKLSDNGVASDSDKSAADAIFKDVGNRVLWVASTMQDETTGLYHHGWDADNAKGNGHFWGRGIGWYAAALVDVIELMPSGLSGTDTAGNAVSDYKVALQGYLDELFDPMLKYQDAEYGWGGTTGMWYNVVNRDSSLKGDISNALETSVTGLMAYAMMKAYNNQWVTTTTITKGETEYTVNYGDAAKLALDGIVSQKLNAEGTIVKDTYKSSGVEGSDTGYLKSSQNYVDNEAKGVGPVIWAAAEVYKAEQSEKTSCGILTNKPSVTVNIGETVSASTFEDLEGVIVTTFGKVSDVVAADLEFGAVDTTTEGVKTLDVMHNGVVIDTVEVTVFDPKGPVSQQGSFIVGGSGNTYSLYTGSTVADGTYLIVGTEDNTNWYAMGNPITQTNKSAAPTDTEITVDIANKTATSGADLSDYIWTFKKSGNGYEISNVKNSVTSYIISDAGGGSYISSNAETAHVPPVSALDASAGQYQIQVKSGRNIQFEDGAFVRGGDEPFIYLFSVVKGEKYDVDFQVTPNTVVLAQNGTSTPEVAITVTNASGTEVEYSNPKITWAVKDGSSNVVTVDASGNITAVAEGEKQITATLTALTYDGTEYTLANNGITVTLNVEVTGEEVEPAEIASFTVNLAAMNLYVGDTAASAIAISGIKDVDGKNVPVSGSYTLQFTSDNESVATVNGQGKVVAHAAGNANITATLYKNGVAVENVAPVSIPVNVAEVPTVSLVGGSGTGVTVSGSSATMYTGKRLQLTLSNDSFTVQSWESNNPQIATVSNSGEVTAVSVGQAVITATLATKARATTTATFTVTVVNDPDAPVTGAAGNVIVTIEENTPQGSVVASASGTATVPGTGGNSGGEVYKQASGAIDTSKQYIITYNNNGTYYVIGTSSNTNNPDDSITGVVNANGEITSINGGTDYSKYLWTFASSGNNYIISNSANSGSTWYLGRSDNEKVFQDSSLAVPVSYDSTSGLYTVGISGGRYLAYGEKWTRSSSAVYLTLFTLGDSSTGGSAEDTVYDVSLSTTSQATQLTIGGLNAADATAQLNATATVTGQAGAECEITWASSDSSVVAVDSTGKITAKKAGTATITATVTSVTVGGDVITTGQNLQEIEVSIPVAVTEKKVYQAVLAVTPGNLDLQQDESKPLSMSLAVTDNGTAVDSAKVTGLAYTLSVEDGKTFVECAGNTVTGKTADSGNVIVTLDTITIDGKAGEIITPVTAEVAVNVTVSCSHSYGEGVVTTQPTCTTEGERTFTCSECGATKIEVIPATNHANKTFTPAKEANCYQAGNVAYWHCLDCDKNFSDEACTQVIANVVVSATGEHAWDGGEVITEASCTAEGKTRFTCTVDGCGATKEEPIAKLSHSMTHYDAVAPSCTTAGSVEYWYCSSCSKFYSDAAGTSELASTVDPATGHTENAGVVTTPATCVTAGERTFSCSKCGETLRTEVIPATGVHTYENGTCTVCGKTLSGNISTGSEGGANDDAPLFTPGLFVPVGGSSGSGGQTHNYTIVNGSSTDKTFFSYSDTSYGKESVTYTLPDGTTGTTDAPKKMNSSTIIAFTASAAGTLKMYFSEVSNGESVYVDKTSYTIPESGYLEVTNVAAGSHEVKKNSGESQLGYIQFSTAGSGQATPTGYAQLFGTQGYAFPFGTGSTAIIEAIQNDVSATALQILISQNADGSGASALESGLANGRVTIAKNAEGTVFKDDEEGTYLFSVSLDGKQIGTIPVKIYNPNAAGITWYNGTLALNPGNLDLNTNSADTTIAATVTVVPVEGNGSATMTNHTIIWSSSNQNVVTVDANGKVHVVGAGSATITAKIAKDSSCKVNDVSGTVHEDIVATATVTVTQAAVSSDQYIHNFTKDEKVDPDDVYTITGNLTTGEGTVEYNGTQLTTALKMESSTKVTFAAPGAGTLKLVFQEASSKNIKFSVPGSSTTQTLAIGADGILEIPITAAGEHTILKGTSSTFLYYMEFTPAITTELEISGDGVLDLVGTRDQYSSVLTPTVSFNGATPDSYVITWTTSNGDVVKFMTVDANDKESYFDSITSALGETVSIAAMAVGDDVTITAVVTELNGVATTAEQQALLTDTITVHVNPVTIDSIEDKTVFVGGEGVVVNPVVKVSSALSKFKLEWTVTDEEGNVVNGLLTPSADTMSATIAANAAGTYNVTVKVIEAGPNDYDISGSNITTSFQVHANEITIVGGKLNKNTVNIKQGATEDEVNAILEGINLTLNYNYGDPKVVALFGDSDTGISYAPITTGEIGTQKIGIYYNGVLYDTLTVNILSEDDLSANGTINQVVSVTYNRVNTITPGEEYLIVAIPNAEKPTEGFAVYNEDTGDSNTAGGKYAVTLSDDQSVATIDQSAMVGADWRFTANGTDKYTIQNQNRYFRGDSNFLSREENALAITVKPVSGVSGGFTMLLKSDYYLNYADSKFVRDEEAYTLYLYQKDAEYEKHNVSFTQSRDEVTVWEGADVNLSQYLSVRVDGVDAASSVIQWTVDENAPITVDENGNVHAKGQGSATVTATLVSVNGAAATPNQEGSLTHTFTVNVEQENVTYTLENANVIVPLNGTPDFSKVVLVRTSDKTGVQRIPFGDSRLELKVAQAKIDSSIPGSTYEVAVLYDGVRQTGAETVHVTVGNNAFEGRDEAQDFIGFPDPGAVRIEKWGVGESFLQTGLAHVELNTAGVADSNMVDVVLIVDVSNSMAWNMSVTDENGTVVTKRKLEWAMDTATSFANKLLANDKNTLSLVTFAGFDKDHANGTVSGYIDSVQTVFHSQTKDNLTYVEGIFSGLQFDSGDSTSEKSGQQYELTINGVTGQNDGGTNYDYAFAQAAEAVKAVKAQYEAGHTDTYAESGRKMHVVFMTDGAPSHYNGVQLKSNAHAAKWEGGAYSNVTEAKDAWLNRIDAHNAKATALLPMIDGGHTVGFALEGCTLAGSAYTEAELEPILNSLAKDASIPVYMATDSVKLNTFFDELAAALAYAGTDAKVTDVIGKDFTLFTGVQGNNDTKAYAADNAITITAHTLYQAADFGAGICTADQVGERTGESVILEKVTFNADGTEAYSTLKSGNIMTVDGNTVTIAAEYFTYVKDAEGKETITWNIGNITNVEFSLDYLAYLVGSRDDSKNIGAGIYYTNDSAVLEYVDINGDYARREYAKPQLAWEGASVGVRFYLVNKDGQYVNRAGTVFTEKANRIFLAERAYYQSKLNDSYTVAAAQALIDAGLTNYELYDAGVKVTVQNNSAGVTGEAYTITDGTKDKIADLIDVVDLADDGTYIQAIVDIPVILSDLGESERPMAPVVNVIDFSKPLTMDVFNEEEKQYATGYPNTKNVNGENKTFWYTMEVLGFATYNANADLKDYVLESSIKPTITTAYGTYTVANDHLTVSFTPSTIMTGVDRVFVGIRFNEYYYDNGQVGESTKDYFCMYMPLTLVPANVLYVETDGNMSGAITTTGGWTLQNNAGQAISNAMVNMDSQDEYVQGGIYGYDSSYANNSGLSNGSSLMVVGTKDMNTKASFTFTGTGFDLISRTGKQQGAVKVVIEGDGYKKTVSVINKGETELYQIPIVSVNDIPYGTYTVTITVFPPVDYPNDSLDRGGEFYFDALRIYNPVTTDTVTHDEQTVGDVYAADGQLDTAVTELRDILLPEADYITGLVSNGVIFMDYTADYSKFTVTDYKNMGPNNEIYLAKGQAIAFTLKAADVAAMSSLQLGAKSADGNTVELNVVLTQNDAQIGTYMKEISTATAMYYDLWEGVTVDGNSDLTVTITNTSDSESILSITDMRQVGSSAKLSLVSDMATFAAANNALNPTYEVIDASFDAESVTVMAPAGLTVVTRNIVTDLVITDADGNEVDYSAVYVDTMSGERIWSIRMYPTRLGDVTYTVAGFGANGEAGATATATIHVSL